MNQHLNLFRFFNESEVEQFKENNLSRAFALCISNDPLFFYQYILSILRPDDYEYLFSVNSENAAYLVDLQIEVSTLEIESFRKVYAIAMTADRNLNMDDFLQQPHFPDKQGNILDIWVTIKDIAFVIEVKRTAADCKAQLYNQVYSFLQLNPRPEVIPVNFSWPQVVEIMQKIVNMRKLMKLDAVFVNDFLTLSEIRYQEWFAPKPFAVLPFSTDLGTATNAQLVKRLRQALSLSDFELFVTNDRMGVTVPFDWASEVLPDFQLCDDSIKEYMTFWIYPGNTVQQGRRLYYANMNWIDKDHLDIDDRSYELDIGYNIKISHYMGKFLTGISFTGGDLKGPLLHTRENFEGLSGKWTLDVWDKFEACMDEYFTEAFNWREKCAWHDRIKHGKKTFFNISLGFEVVLYVPFREFREIDRRDTEIHQVAAKMNTIIGALQGLTA